jgi:hypothetical protein
LIYSSIYQHLTILFISYATLTISSFWLTWFSTFLYLCELGMYFAVLLSIGKYLSSVPCFWSLHVSTAGTKSFPSVTTLYYLYYTTAVIYAQIFTRLVGTANWLAFFLPQHVARISSPWICIWCARFIPLVKLSLPGKHVIHWINF